MFKNLKQKKHTKYGVGSDKYNHMCDRIMSDDYMGSACIETFNAWTFLSCWLHVDQSNGRTFLIFRMSFHFSKNYLAFALLEVLQIRWIFFIEASLSPIPILSLVNILSFLLFLCLFIYFLSGRSMFAF